MPSFKVSGFRLIVNTRDERGHKPHVHIVKDNTKVKITLDTSLTPYDRYKMSLRDIERARQLVGANFGRLTKWWDTYNA